MSLRGLHEQGRSFSRTLPHPCELVAGLTHPSLLIREACAEPMQTHRRTFLPNSVFLIYFVNALRPNGYMRFSEFTFFYIYFVNPLPRNGFKIFLNTYIFRACGVARACWWFSLLFLHSSYTLPVCLIHDRICAHT